MPRLPGSTMTPSKSASHMAIRLERVFLRREDIGREIIVRERIAQRRGKSRH